MRVTRLQLRDFRSYERGGAAARARAHRRRRPQRRRQDEPARGALLRLHRPLVPDGQRARGRPLRRAADAAGARGRGRARRATRSRVGFQPGEPKRLRVDGAPVERLTDVAAPPARRRSSCPTGSSSCSARRRCGARTSTRSSPRCGRPRRHAPRLRARRSRQRNALIAGDPRRPRRPRLAAGLGRRARPPRHRADARPRRGGRPAARRASPRTPAALGLEGEAELAYRPRSKAQDAEALAAELAERADGDLERGFTGHGPHRDDLAFRRDGPRAARLRLARPAAARRCWRCCSPSARSWPPSAARRR